MEFDDTDRAEFDTEEISDGMAAASGHKDESTTYEKPRPYVFTREAYYVQVSSLGHSMLLSWIIRRVCFPRPLPALPS